MSQTKIISFPEPERNEDGIIISKHGEDHPINAWIKNEDYPDGQLVFQPPSILQKIDGVEYDFERVQRLLGARVDIDHPRKLPQFILGQHTSDGIINMLSLGNISMIQGKKKARKGFSAAMIMSTLIAKKPDRNSGLVAIPVKSGKVKLDPRVWVEIYPDFRDFLDADPDFLQIFATEKPKNKIVIVDTEQSEDDVIVATKRIMKLSGCDKFQIITLFARENTMQAKIEIMELELRGRTDVLFVLLDGGVDMVADSNKIDESSALVTNILLPLSSKLNCHIMVVIHENKYDGEARGHLGLILGQKAEAIIGVELTEGKEDTHSTVRCIASRRKNFHSFMFEVKEDELPYYVSDPVAVKKKEKVAQDQVNTASMTHDNIIRFIFEKAKTSSIPMKQFRDLLKIELTGIGIKKTGVLSLDVWVEYYQSTYKKIVVEGKTSAMLVRQYGAADIIPIKIQEDELS